MNYKQHALLTIMAFSFSLSATTDAVTLFKDAVALICVTISASVNSAGCNCNSVGNAIVVLIAGKPILAFVLPDANTCIYI